MNTIGTLTNGHGAVVTIVKKRDVGYHLMPNYKPSETATNRLQLHVSTIYTKIDTLSRCVD